MQREVVKDKFGPECVVRVYDSKIGMEGFLVICNSVLGPGKGGIRMTPNVTEEEVCRLAQTMTWKNVLADIPFCGAKAGIVWAGGSDALKKQFVQSFARLISLFIPQKYIAGPDVNTGEKEMKWFAEAIGKWESVTGKPTNFCVKVGRSGKKCGLPHELGSTGFGVAQAALVAAKLKGIDIKKAVVAIEGFGNVGSFAFKHLKKNGAKIVAVADSKGTAFLENGLDEKKIIQLKSRGKSVADYPGAKKLKHDGIFGLKVDILIPATVTDVINAKNKNRIKAKIIVEGANIPMSEKIEDELFKKGILIVPDFVANAGGVISSYAEYKGFSPEKMFELIEKKIKKITKTVLEESLKKNKNPRTVAFELAKAKIERKMKFQ